MIQNASSQDREWELLFGAGVKDPTVFSHFMTNVRKYGASIDVSEVMSHFEHKGHCALMLIDTWVWQHYEGPDRELWQPETLGQARTFVATFRALIYLGTRTAINSCVCVPTLLSNHRCEVGWGRQQRQGFSADRFSSFSKPRDFIYSQSRCMTISPLRRLRALWPRYPKLSKKRSGTHQIRWCCCPLCAAFAAVVR
jgi:hypothetical protein